jgi:hypothetical protein
VEAGLSGCGGCQLSLFLEVAVGCPGGFVLGGGEHGRVDVLPRALVTDQFGFVQGVQSLN